LPKLRRVGSAAVAVANSRYLAVIALFVNGVKGTSALQISRDLNINPKCSLFCAINFAK
jgi:hypothetical protein